MIAPLSRQCRQRSQSGLGCGCKGREEDVQETEIDLTGSQEKLRAAVLLHSGFPDLKAREARGKAFKNKKNKKLKKEKKKLKVLVQILK